MLLNVGLYMVFEVVRRLPVISQSYGLTRAAMRSCETGDPVEALKCSAVRLAKYCTPPHVLMPLRCGIFAAQLCLTASTGWNPWATSITLATARQIIDWWVEII